MRAISYVLLGLVTAAVFLCGGRDWRISNPLG